MPNGARLFPYDSAAGCARYTGEMARSPRRARSAWAKRIVGADLLDGPLPVLPGPARSLPRPAERDVLQACLRLCELHPKVGWCRRMNVGGVERRGPSGERRWIQFGFVGLSDIIGQMADGRFIAIEVKRPGGRATREQEAFLAAVAAHNGIAAVVDNVEALKRVLDRI